MSDIKYTFSQLLITNDLPNLLELISYILEYNHPKELIKPTNNLIDNMILLHQFKFIFYTQTQYVASLAQAQ